MVYIFKQFACLGLSGRHPGRHSLSTRGDFHSLHNNREDHNNHHHHYNNHHRETDRRPLLHPLRPSRRARRLHAGREEVRGETQGSGLKGDKRETISPVSFSVSCKETLRLWDTGKESPRDCSKWHSSIPFH